MSLIVAGKGRSFSAIFMFLIIHSYGLYYLQVKQLNIYLFFLIDTRRRKKDE